MWAPIKVFPFKVSAALLQIFLSHMLGASISHRGHDRRSTSWNIRERQEESATRAIPNGVKHNFVPATDLNSILNLSIQDSWQSLRNLQTENKLKKVKLDLRKGHSRLSHGFLMSTEPSPNFNCPTHS